MDHRALHDVAEGLLRQLEPDTFTREGLEETPARWAKAMERWMGGYDVDPKSVLKTFTDGAGDKGMVFQQNIPVWSHCEHHLAPFFGVAHVAYIPDGKIVGLSKLFRLVDVFARRLQVQERLTSQVADAMWEHLQPLGVGVVLRCRHLCMESRGVERSGTTTTTTKLHGAFLDRPEAREEFMGMVNSVTEVAL